MAPKKAAGAKALAPEDFLKGLALQEQAGMIVQPFEFTTADREALQEWLLPEAIDTLQSFVEKARAVEMENRDEPTLGDSRAVLARIEVLAAALSIAIRQAPTHASAELDLIGHHLFKNPRKLEATALELLAVSGAIRERLDELPSQSPRRAHPFLVSGIARAAEASGVNVSDSEHGRFCALCACVFKAVGIHQDPRGSIRAYLAIERERA